MPASDTVAERYIGSGNDVFANLPEGKLASGLITAGNGFFYLFKGTDSDGKPVHRWLPGGCFSELPTENRPVKVYRDETILALTRL